uniref:Uncharacterized protein n=1 Tax=viral metagenome TaxID=1070528 RepID=A0A2V0RI11_9ZZZZ
MRREPHNFSPLLLISKMDKMRKVTLTASRLAWGQFVRLVGDAMHKGTTCVVITGTSGTGKSRTASELKKLFDVGDEKWKMRFHIPQTYTVKVVNLDKHSSADGDKWHTNEFPLVKADLVIYEGTSDNMTSVGEMLVKRYGSDQTLFCVPIPPHDVFQIAQGLKAKEGLENDLPQAWITGWKSKAKLSSPKMLDYIEKWTRQFVSHSKRKPEMEDLNLYLVSIPHSGTPLTGWHQDGDSVDNEVEPSKDENNG